MRHSHGFVPHDCCTARACVDVAIPRHFDVSPRPFFQGVWEGAFFGEQASLLFFPRPRALARVDGSVSGARDDLRVAAERSYRS